MTCLRLCTFCLFLLFVTPVRAGDPHPPQLNVVAAIMAGLLPIMWSHGTGAEVMQRIAVPMIGGMVSSTLLTLIVIPSIYAVVKGHSAVAKGAPKSSN